MRNFSVFNRFVLALGCAAFWIFSTFAGQFGPSATPGILDNVETGEIVGGTGRFEGATGPSHRSGPGRR